MSVKRECECLLTSFIGPKGLDKNGLVIFYCSSSSDSGTTTLRLVFGVFLAGAAGAGGGADSGSESGSLLDSGWDSGSEPELLDLLDLLDD